MAEKELRFQAIKAAQEIVFSSDYTNFPPRVQEGLTERVVNIADFMLAYVNKEHEEIVKKQKKEREESSRRILEIAKAELELERERAARKSWNRWWRK